MKNKKLPPIHPGEILIEEFLKPMGLSQYRLAKDIFACLNCLGPQLWRRRSTFQMGFDYRIGGMLFYPIIDF